MNVTKKSVLGVLGLFVLVMTAFALLSDVSSQVDPFVHTEDEAREEHAVITLAAEEEKQTQAGFNAYTLKVILMQELEILELQILAEADEEKKILLKERLASKKSFILKLEEEEQRQMLKGRQS